MTACCGRLACAILGISFAFQAACSIGAKAQEAGAGSPTSGACSSNGAAFDDALSKPHWNGWGVDPSQHRFQSPDMARLAESDLPRLKLKWAFGFPGATRSVAQPTIVGGRVFVGSQGGKVYSLDAKGGCTYWEFGASKGVRSAIVIGQRSDGWAAYFGDAGANVYSVDALTGKELWRTRVDDHPAAVITGSPTLVGTTLFVPVSSYEEVTGANKSYSCCTFRGSVVALDASTGKVLWKAFSIAEEAKPGATNAAGVQLRGPSGAAIWSAPTFDVATKRIYATTGDNYSDPPTETSDAILAFDAGSGERTWSRQITSGDAYNVACGPPARQNCPKANGPDFDFGSSAVLANRGLADPASRLRRPPRMQSGAIGRRDRHPRTRLFGRTRRSASSLFGRRRPHCLGRRHEGRLSDNQWRRREWRLHRRRGSRRRRRHGLCRIGIRLCWNHARERPARILR